MEEERRWEELGVDCLANIFARLDLEDLTVSVPFVCRPWLEASLDPQCWRVLNFGSLDLMPWSSFNVRFKRAYGVEGRFTFAGLMRLLVERSRGSAVELAFPSTFSATLEELVFASIKCPKLKAIVLPNLFYEDEKHLQELIGKWEELEFLEMRHKPRSFVKIIEQIGLKCRNFRGLKLYGCVEEEDALAIVKYLPKLEYLDLSGSLLDRDMLIAILDGCRELEELNVSRCRGFDVDDAILKRASCVGVFKHHGAKMEEEYPDGCFEYEDMHWGLVF